jgi:hydroxymethylglutaryl-CoA reductase
MSEPKPSALNSRLPGFYAEPLERRRSHAAEAAGLSDEARAHLAAGGPLPLEVADRMSENVIATHALPLSIGLNFRVNGRDVLVPMATEEPSVVAAASNAARLVRLGGGFTGVPAQPVMTAQVQLDRVPEAATAAARVRDEAARILAAGDAAIPRMVARGGGCRAVDCRVLDADEGLVVLHVHVDVGDAMGANLCDTVAEAVAPVAREVLGGEIGLRILTNLAVQRTVRVEAEVPIDALGEALAVGIARASRVAELDPYRAVTHNKGIMNGVDAVALALGQDFRALEAGAHGFAALDGRYRPLATWDVVGDRLSGRIVLPMAVATVGGCATVHPGVRAALELVAVSSAGELGVVMAAVGLASNLAALRALAGEGIQKGHMRLHHRKTGEA